MKLAFLTTLLLFPPAARAAGLALPIFVEYVKTGTESHDEAQALGRDEMEKSNPCILKMNRDLASFLKGPEVKGAVESAIRQYKDEPADPRFVLHFMNEAMELRFELWLPEIKNLGGSIAREKRPVYRKSVYLTADAGNWQDRLDNESCHVREKKFAELLDEIREADRLAACTERKTNLFQAASIVSNYVHHYLPYPWYREARRQLQLQGGRLGDVLREDMSIYNSSETSFRDCHRGLKLLEENAAASVRLLDEIARDRKGTDVPNGELDTLEKLLVGGK